MTLRDSPFWCLHPVYCNDVHIHHMAIRSRMYAPNSDGIDPDSSRNVMIEHNDVSTGDDNIAIKAVRRSANASPPPRVCSDASPAHLPSTPRNPLRRRAYVALHRQTIARTPSSPTASTARKT